MEDVFRVVVKNKILGDHTNIMTMEQIASFNVVALMLAKRCVVHGGSHTEGMWTVERVPPGKEGE